LGGWLAHISDSRKENLVVAPESTLDAGAGPADGFTNHGPLHATDNMKEMIARGEVSQWERGGGCTGAVWMGLQGTKPSKEGCW